MLENLALKYDVPLPERNPISMEVPRDPEVIEDRFMYQQIYLGVDSMLDMHIRAIVELIRNDGLKESFVKLWREEIDAFNLLLKFGKLKGWTQLPPLLDHEVSG